MIWSPIRIQVGPVHMQFGSPYDCARLLTELLVRLHEQAPAEAAEWVRRDALRLCPTRPAPVEQTADWTSRKNAIIEAPNQEHIR